MSILVEPLGSVFHSIMSPPQIVAEISKEFEMTSGSLQSPVGGIEPKFQTCAFHKLLRELRSHTSADNDDDVDGIISSSNISGKLSD